MRVMINLLSSGSGGAMSYVRNLIPLLATRFANSSDHKLFILAFNKHLKELGTLPETITVIEVKKERGGAERAIWEMVAVPKIVQQNQIDIFYTPYQLAPNVRKAKTVTMIRNMEPFRFTKFRQTTRNYLRNTVLRAASKKTLSRADRVLAVSDYAKQECLDIGIDPFRIHRIYHGRDTRFSPDGSDDDLAALQSLKIKGDYIFTCGSILPYRRVEHIISAFNAWEESNKYQLVIAGSGNDPNYSQLLEERIAESRVPENIIQLGFVSPEVMRTLYRNCRLFVTATDIEACPNMGIEALSSGCHILSSDNPPMPEIFQGAAQYFSSENISELAHMLPKAWEAATAINQKALARAAAFSWELCASETFRALTNWP